MADENHDRADGIPRKIDLLLFNFAGMNMAVDADQVEGIISSEQAEERTIVVGGLSGLLGMGTTAVVARSKVLLFSDEEETYGLGIDGLDSIEHVNIGAIQPLPVLLSDLAGVRPFWGVIPRGNEVILLIDLFRLKGLLAGRSEIFA